MRILQNLLVLVLAIYFLSSPVFGQLPNDPRSATLDGTPGLFRAWDAEPIRPGEIFASAGLFRNHRDPGELTLTVAPASLAIGLFNRFEIFGMLEVQKRVEADSIRTYRISPGEPSRPAQTLLGERLFSSSAPFIDVPRSTGRGDMWGNMKFNILSQSAGKPVALSAVGIGKLPGHKTLTGLNRGLSTGDTEVGFGVLASRRQNNGAQVHVNALWYFAGDPVINGVGISDIHHRFILRAGAMFPLLPKTQAIAELELNDYFGHDVPGHNPTSPVDILFGLRIHPSSVLALSGGYLASVNHIDEDPSRAIRAAPTSGFVFQVGFAVRRQGK
jgi:hypothetical protein